MISYVFYCGKFQNKATINATFIESLTIKKTITQNMLEKKHAHIILLFHNLIKYLWIFKIIYQIFLHLNHPTALYKILNLFADMSVNHKRFPSSYFKH